MNHVSIYGTYKKVDFFESRVVKNKGKMKAHECVRAEIRMKFQRERNFLNRRKKKLEVW